MPLIELELGLARMKLNDKVVDKLVKKIDKLENLQTLRIDLSYNENLDQGRILKMAQRFGKFQLTNLRFGYGMTKVSQVTHHKILDILKKQTQVEVFEFIALECNFTVEEVQILVDIVISMKKLNRIFLDLTNNDLTNDSVQ